MVRNISLGNMKAINIKSEKLILPAIGIGTIFFEDISKNLIPIRGIFRLRKYILI